MVLRARAAGFMTDRHGGEDYYDYCCLIDSGKIRQID